MERIFKLHVTFCRFRFYSFHNNALYNEIHDFTILINNSTLVNVNTFSHLGHNISLSITFLSHRKFHRRSKL